VLAAHWQVQRALRLARARRQRQRGRTEAAPTELLR